MTKKTSLMRYWKAGCLLSSFVIFISGCVAVLVISKAISLAPRSFSIPQTEPPPTDPYILSTDQQALVKQLGYPDAFAIQFYADSQHDQGRPETRLEIWTYYLAGQEITLLNGRVLERVEIDILSGALAPARYRPEQFAGNMNVTAALHASGLQEVIKVPLETEGVSGGTLLYGEQIVFGFQDDQFLYVESFALEEGVQP